MSESSRRKLHEQVAHQLTKDLVDDGKLIAAGYVLFARYCIPKNASQAQIDDMRVAFMAGADHLFASIMTILDPGEEASDADERRLDLINAELAAFRAHMAVHVPSAYGRN